MSELAIAELTIDADVPIPESLTESALTSLSHHVLSAEAAEGAWTLGFRFVDDTEMQAMHLAFMGLDSPTDIMTFPNETDDAWSFGGDEDEEDVESTDRGGDIVISVDTAAAQAEDGDWGLEEELRFLVVHGLLHLLGWDDHDDDDRAAMLNRQRDLIASWLASGASA
ncbi:MAG: rRNA maturation RNase YbeY [Thermomicrobiales bacterium]